ncbi:MAG: efflux RND transporter periplasmic adaptor subunit [Rariglobus sp.]
MKRILLLGGLLLSATSHGFAIEFGYTEPNRIALVAFPEAGVIAEISVKEGVRVKEGQALAKLNCETLVQDLRIGEEQQRLLQLRFDQIKALYAADNVSKEEHEKAKSDLAIASLRVQRILAQINDRTLRAPFDGIVTKINREVAESVSAAQTEVMTVLQLDSLKVTLHLSVQAATGIVQGKEVPLVLDGKTRVKGIAEFVSPVIDAASHTVRVTFSIPNAEGLYRSGVRCTLDVEGAATSGEAPVLGRDGTAAGANELPLPARRPRATGGEVPVNK